jgi:predicted DNA-binding transcriptional regulator AlpA
MTDDPIRTRRETAEIMRVSVRTLQRMEAQGEMPPRIRISERIFGYRESALRAHLDARTAPIPGLTYRWTETMIAARHQNRHASELFFSAHGKAAENPTDGNTEGKQRSGRPGHRPKDQVRIGLRVAADYDPEQADPNSAQHHPCSEEHLPSVLISKHSAAQDEQN